MPELTLYFEAPEGTDLDTTASALQQKVVALPQVASAETMATPSRMVGLAEIIAAVTLATTLIKSSTDAVKAITELVEAAKGLATALGLRHPTVGVGSIKVPLDQLTAENLQALSKAQAPS